MSSKNPEPAADTKSRILQAALGLLLEAQGNGVRMSDIARQAGVSRQAVYLHYPTRAELLIAATRFVDERNSIDARLAASRSARSGTERLNAFIEAWGNYIPEIYGISRALLTMRDTDEAAAEAWNGRMNAMREGCEAAIKALQADNTLCLDYTVTRATDLLWTLLSIRNWEHLTIDCGWPQRDYIETLQTTARKTLVR